MINKQRGLPAQAGVSLIMVFFIMVIILSVALSISILLYSEVKVIRNVENSMVSLYAADSGIEKVLFYDRQVIPEGAKRGLCSIPTTCSNDTQPNVQEAGNISHSIYCNGPPSISGPGCNPSICNDCEVSFDTTFDDRTYHVKATIFPNNEDPEISGIFEIDSRGVFGGTQRKIQIYISPPPE
jgi:hypothetical protein